MVHLIPQAETEQHVPSLECWCEPTPIFADAAGAWFPRGPLVVHGDDGETGLDLDGLTVDRSQWHVEEEI